MTYTASHAKSRKRHRQKNIEQTRLNERNYRARLSEIKREMIKLNDGIRSHQMRVLELKAQFKVLEKADSDGIKTIEELKRRSMRCDI